MNNQLIEYLKTLVSLEQTNYELSSIRNNITREIKNTDNIGLLREEDIESFFSYIKAFWDEHTELIYGIAAFVAIVVFVFIIMLHINFFLKILIVLLLSLLISFSFFMPFLFLKYKIRKAKVQKNNNIIAEKNQQTEQFKKSKSRALDMEMIQITPKIKETNELLQQYYDLGIIYTKYRNYASVASLLEYFEAGRCSTLGEAYNILEMEMRFNNISTKLDTIVSSLDEIKDNQDVLYSSLNRANRNIENVTGRINSIANNVSKNNAQLASLDYTNQITQRNVEYLSRMEFYRQLGI